MLASEYWVTEPNAFAAIERSQAPGMSCSCVVKGLGAVGGSLKSRAPAGRATQPSRVVTFHRVT